MKFIYQNRLPRINFLLLFAIFTVGTQSQHPPVNGEWSPWSGYSACNRPCNGGTQSRSRTCSNPFPKDGGRDCQGTKYETQKCNTHPCPVHGGWSNWGGWSNCSGTCGGGLQTRSRLCNNPAPAYNGSDCNGNSSETQQCKTRQCPIHGGWGNWEGWSNCSVTCGGGLKTRGRLCDNPAPAHKGRKCTGNSSEAQQCNTRQCPATRTNTTPATPTTTSVEGMLARSTAKIKALRTTDEDSLMNAVEIISRLLKALEKEPVKKNAVNVLLATRKLESFASNYTKIYFKANESRVIYKEHFGRSQKKMVACEGPVSQRTSLLKQPNIKAKDRSYEKIMPIRPYHQPEYYSLLRFLLGYLPAFTGLICYLY